MEITTVEGFLKYYEGIRQRTLRVIERIPPGKIDWTYREGKWTLGDLVRHIAAIERDLWGEVVQGRPSRYAGCGKDLADGYDEVLAYFNRMHEDSVAIFGGLSPDDLQAKCTTPAGVEMTTWKWLRALVEHEIHDHLNHVVLPASADSSLCETVCASRGRALVSPLQGLSWGVRWSQDVALG